MCRFEVSGSRVYGSVWGSWHGCPILWNKSIQGLGFIVWGLDCCVQSLASGSRVRREARDFRVRRRVGQLREPLVDFWIFVFWA